MFKVGLTGGIGCGKTTIARLFLDLGVPVIDADEVSRELVLPGQPAFDAIAARFGDEVVGEKGLDRAKLRQQVFANAVDRRWLEALLHPMVFERMQKWMDNLQAGYGLCVVPLLLESGQRNFVDRILVVDCDPEVQRRRVGLRDGMDEQGVERVMAAQVSRETRLAEADDVIFNNEAGSGELFGEVNRLHHLYQRLGRQTAA